MTLKATTSLLKQNASLLHLFLMYINDRKKNTFIQVILEQFFFFPYTKLQKPPKSTIESACGDWERWAVSQLACPGLVTSTKQLSIYVIKVYVRNTQICTPCQTDIHLLSVICEKSCFLLLAFSYFEFNTFAGHTKKKHANSV